MPAFNPRDRHEAQFPSRVAYGLEKLSELRKSEILRVSCKIRLSFLTPEFLRDVRYPEIRTYLLPSHAVAQPSAKKFTAH
jgi:hypothetical protein